MRVTEDRFWPGFLRSVRVMVVLLAPAAVFTACTPETGEQPNFTGTSVVSSGGGDPGGGNPGGGNPGGGNPGGGNPGGGNPGGGNPGGGDPGGGNPGGGDPGGGNPPTQVIRTIDVDVEGDVEGEDGNDEITLRDGTIGGGILTAAGDDVVSLLGGNVGAVDLGAGDDTAGLGGNVVDDTDDEMDGTQAVLVLRLPIDGGAGSDTFRLSEGSKIGNLRFSDEAPDAGRGDVHLQDIEIIHLDGGEAEGNIASGSEAITFRLTSGAVGVSTNGDGTTYSFLGGGGDDLFLIEGNMVDPVDVAGTPDDPADDVPALRLEGYLDGRGGVDTLELASGGVVASIAFSDLAPSGGALHLQNIEILHLDGGEAAGSIASGSEAIMFRLTRGAVGVGANGDGTTHSFLGGGGDDLFLIEGNMVDPVDVAGTPDDPADDVPALRLEGYLDGGGGVDTLELTSGGVVASIAFSNQAPSGGALHLQNIETLRIDGGTVNGDIIGGAGDETYEFASGLIGGFVDGGAGSDTLVLDGATVPGLDLGPASPAGNEFDIRGIETLRLLGSTITGNVEGSAGDETFEFLSGGIDGYLDGGGGVDTFTAAEAAAGLAVRLTTANGDTQGDLRLRNIETITLTSHADSLVLAVDLPALGQSMVIDGGAGSDRFTLVSGGITGLITASGSGDPGAGNLRLLNIETIRLEGGIVTGNIIGSAGDETYEFASGLIGGFLDGGGGDDLFLIEGNMVDPVDVAGTPDDPADDVPALRLEGYLDGGGGTDTLELASGGVVASIAFSSQASSGGALHLQNIETIRLNGGMVTGNVEGGAGDEIFEFVSGGIGGFLDGGAGGDTLELLSGAVVASIAFSSQASSGGALHLQNIETIRLNGGMVTGNVEGGAGDEIFEFVSGGIGGYLDGGGGADTFTAAETAAGLAVRLTDDDGDTGGDLRLRNIETITLTSHADSFVLAVDLPALGQSMVLDGGAGSDRFTLEAGGMADSITSSGSGDPGAGNLRLLNIETIRLEGGIVTGNIIGSAGDETFEFASGLIGGFLDGGAGIDTMVLDGAAAAGIDLGPASPAGNEFDIRGIETLRLLDSTINGNILGTGEDENFFINAGTTVSGFLDGGAGRDTLTLDGVTRSAGIDLGPAVPAGNDFDIRGIEDLRLLDSTITGNILGTGEDENFLIGAGTTVSGFLDGGAGSDMLVLDGVTVAGIDLGPASPAGNELDIRGIETLGLLDSTITGNILGTGEDENFVIGAGTTLEGFLDGGAGSDTFRLAGGEIGNLRFSGNAPGSGRGDVHLQNIEIVHLDGGAAAGNIASGSEAITFRLTRGAVGDGITYSFLGGGGDDLFLIEGNMVDPVDVAGTPDDPADDVPALRLDGLLDGGDGTDTLELASGAVFTRVDFRNDPSFGGRLHLQRIEIIRLSGGEVRGPLSATNPIFDDQSADHIELLLESGGIGGDIEGSPGDDRFEISGDVVSGALRLDGHLDGGGGTDTLELAPGGVVASIAFSNQAPSGGALHLQNIETLRIDGGIVNSDIIGGAGDETYEFAFGLIGGFLAGGAGSDTLVLDGATVRGLDLGPAVPAGNEFDIRGIETLRLLDSTINGNILGTGEDENFFINAGTTVRGFLDGGTGSDTLTLDGVTLAGIDLGPAPPAGNDFDIRRIEDLRLMDSTINGNIIGSGEDDNIVMRGETTVSGYIDGGAGSDTLTLDGVTLDGGINLGSGSGGDVCAGRTLSGGGSYALDIRGIETLELVGFRATSPGFICGSSNDDNFVVRGDFVLEGIIHGGVGSDTLTLDSITTTDVRLVGFTRSIQTYRFLRSGIRGDILGTVVSDDFVIGEGSRVGGHIDGAGGGEDTLTLGDNQVAESVAFSNAPSGDAFHLQNIEAISIAGSQVTGDVDLSAAPAAITFTLTTGMIGGNVIGSPHGDSFTLAGGTIGGYLDGGAGADVLRYAGATGTAFTAAFGLADEDDITDADGSVRNIESQTAPAFTAGRLSGLGGAFGLSNAGFNAGRVREAVGSGGAGFAGGADFAALNFERLSLSPTLSLYGLMGDALMVFGTQMAEGLALAPAGPASPDALPQARLNVLTNAFLSRSNPVAGRAVWAHQISQKGRAQGDIGLAIRGLTARAEGGYDYRTTLNQQGLDSRLSEGRWGTLGLRLTAHTLTGAIETQGAQALTRGYGAGLALLWRNGALSANLTGLAGFYEVAASTDAVFPAFQSVMAASVTHRRALASGLVMRMSGNLVWQSLSLDDPAEGGAAPLAAVFENASRFAGRLEAGLESEHWFADLALVHETESGGALTSGLRQDYRSLDGTAFESRFGGRIADLLPGLTLKADAGLRTASFRSADVKASLRLDWRF